MAKSWKNEVQGDNTGTWTSNGLRFATKKEAEAHGSELFSRWTAVRAYRAAESDDPVNSRWDFSTYRSVFLQDEEKANAPG